MVVSRLIGEINRANGLALLIARRDGVQHHVELVRLLAVHREKGTRWEEIEYELCSTEIVGY